MQIQFDPFSFAVACVATLIAWRAHYLARTAPARERVQAHRDRVREALVTVQDTFDLLTKDDGGLVYPIHPVTDSFSAAVRTIESTGSRLPEVARVISLAQSLKVVERQWGSLVRWAGELREAEREYEEASPDDQHSWNERIQEALSAQDALSDDLKGSIAEAAPEVDDYRSSLDEDDRTLKWKRRAEPL